ncbi:Transient receptor potential channel pyrexia [Daphnia sinensis]|uniref:Transient receptor potential channel pyrexia n=1 Tax=Daphnia sinensis TaxID=1820382 RepID=A0AAD5LMA7_9CRUS|nr:Transient receptor potential channel pyrexia [Daphnia sinensis]
MNNHIRMEYMHLLPWRRLVKENGDEELGIDDDNLSESETHYHDVNNPRGSVYSKYSLNEGDLKLLGFIREDNGIIEETETNSGMFCATVNQRLMMAIEDRDTGGIEFCLKNGADPNGQYGPNKITALHLATVGAPEAIQVLLKHGADVKAADSRGITPLHLAAGIGCENMVQQLIVAGANVNVQDYARENGGGQETPLHRAAVGGHLEALRQLIHGGAQVDIGEARGRTPLHYAAQRGAAGCIQALLDYQADPNLCDKAGATALLLLGGGYLIKGHRRVSGYSESVEILIRGGAKVNVKDPNTGVTPLHQAVTLGRLESTKLLLASGADLTAQDSEGGTPFHSCALKGQASTLKYLLSQPGAREAVNLADSKGRMPLHKAAYRGSAECIQLLLKAGADLGAKTKTGLSAATLILQLPNGAKILSKRLDESIISNGIDPSEVACRIKFDYSVLLTKHKFQQMGVIEDIMDDRRQRRTADLLQHPVIESFLFLKWRKIRFLFFSNILLYLILVSGVTAYVLSSVWNDPISPVEPQITTISPNLNISETVTEPLTTSPIASEPETVMQLQLSLNIIILIIIVQEAIQFTSLHYQYFREPESWIKLGALVTSTIVIFSAPPWPSWVHHVSAVAVLLGWSEVTLLLGRLPTFGVYALMFYAVAQHLVKFIFVFFFFLAGFSFSFHLVFKDKHETFSSPGTSLLRTFAMMIGDTSYDDYMTEGNVSLEGTAHVIYFFFLVLVSLILMNLLIGLAVNDIQGLQNEGRVKRLRKQAEFIVYLEDIVSNRFLRWVLFCSGIIQRLNMWINLEPVFTFSPAGRKMKVVVLPSSTVERAVAIVQEGRVPVESMTISDTYNLLHECVASIGTLRQRIESLERGLIGPLSATALPDSGSSETVELTGNAGVSQEPPDSADQQEDSDSSVSELDYPKSHKGDPDGISDHRDGPYSRLGRSLSRKTNKTTKTVLKRSIQSELLDIKRMLITLTSKSDISP